ncbi:alternate-type signal peptide domain-containing protein [Nocardioides sp. WS12]|uniref:alternate-type signal peptide domain-containing protein n=1 Tax=Nocardioides sp. WS12 TaxID=2486272 RepID=UPI0015FB7022|nr:alternate-type signal peptide domain-containing protein [Nocardioides sp. WS12]
MKKSTKGALAAGSAAVLLMGGAGTLAYWTDNATVAGTEIATGHLKLIEADCGDGWVLDAGTPTEALFVAQLLVPGDSVSQTCTYEVDSVGDHIAAEITVDQGAGFTGDAELLEELDLSASTIEVDGATYAGAVSVDDGDVVEVTFVAQWPFDDAVDDEPLVEGAGAIDNGSNVSGGLQAALDAVGVTLTQVDTH